MKRIFVKAFCIILVIAFLKATVEQSLSSMDWVKKIHGAVMQQMQTPEGQETKKTISDLGKSTISNAEDIVQEIIESAKTYDYSIWIPENQ